MKLTKEQAAVYHEMELMERAGAALAAGFDPIEVFKRCGKWAFDPAAEQIAEIYRRQKAARKARPRKAGEARP